MIRTPQIAHGRVRLRASAALLLAGLAIALHLAHAPAASASTSQVSVIQDGLALTTDTSGTMNRFRELGANTIRYLVFWKDIAPDGNARRAPKFNASDPSAYPKRNWARLDLIVTQAKEEGLKLDLDLTGPPPNWAQGAGVPAHVIKNRFGWRPNAADYGQFVQAVAHRYDGTYRVNGTTLPKVAIWSLWNEPNFGQDLGPQAVGATSRFTGYLVAPGYYRNLLRTGYAALQRYVRGTKVLVGEYAGQGLSGPVTPGRHGHPQGLPGDYAIAHPVTFIDTLYCVDAYGHRLTGTVARMAACPANASQARAFRKNNPALFQASAVSMHPYASTFAPNTKAEINSQDIILPVIGRLSRLMSAVTGDWGDRKNFPIWSTEYGYITSPPQKTGHHYPSPATAAVYLNESEYLSYKNREVASYAQYLLKDPPVLTGVGLFASGLLTDRNKLKPGFNAYRMPLWMPSQSAKRNAKVEVWGGARPADLAGSGARRVQIQQRRGGSWKTLSTVTASASNGYFDTHLAFGAGGQVRLAYTYPKSEPFLPIGIAGTTIYSRTINITVR